MIKKKTLLYPWKTKAVRSFETSETTHPTIQKKIYCLNPEKQRQYFPSKRRKPLTRRLKKYLLLDPLKTKPVRSFETSETIHPTIQKKTYCLTPEKQR
jgi:hypothetical protein